MPMSNWSPSESLGLTIDDQMTKVLVEQVGAVDATRLGNLVGHVTPEEMWGIDEALLTVLGLA